MKTFIFTSLLILQSFFCVYLVLSLNSERATLSNVEQVLRSERGSRRPVTWECLKEKHEEEQREYSMFEHAWDRSKAFGSRSDQPGPENPLFADFINWPTDARSIHKWLNYFDVYHRHLIHLRYRKINVLEIGVGDGGSLRMWQNYFGPQVHLYGVDVVDHADYADKQTTMLVGDQGDSTFLARLAGSASNEPNLLPDRLHMVMDDGSHRPEHQIATFRQFLLKLTSDGVYLCEDTGTNYWPMFGGEADPAAESRTFLDLVQRLVHVIHAAHVRPEYWERYIDKELVPFTLLPGADRDAEVRWWKEVSRSIDNVHIYDQIIVIERRNHTLSTASFRMPENIPVEVSSKLWN